MSGEDGKVIIGTELDTKDFDRELEHLQDKLNNLVDEYEVIKNSKPFEGQDEELAKLSKEINKTKKQMSALVIEKDKMEKANLRSVDFQLKNIGESIKEVTSKVAKWTLAVFGVRSAYMFVRNSISTIANADEQLKSDIDTMKSALAYTIEPLVRSIVNLAKQLMGYIAYIVKAWTGRDIFAQANKSLASANKNAKELQKSSASFDKFNKLSGSGAGAGGGAMALQTPTNPPKWVQWIADNKKIIEDFGKVLLGAFGISAISKILKNIGTLFGVSKGVGLVGLAELLAIIGTAYIATIAVKGVVEAINQMKELNKQFKEITIQAQKNKEKNEELQQSFWDLYNQGKLNDDQVKSYIKSVSDDIDIQSDLIKQIEKQKKYSLLSSDAKKELNKQEEIAVERIKDSIDNYKKLNEQVGLNDQQQKDYKTSLEKAMDILSKQGEEVENLQIDYEKLTGKKYELTIEANMNTDKAEKDYGNFMTRLAQKMASSLNISNWSIFKKSGGFRAKGGIYYGNQIPRLAGGGIVNMPGSGVAYHGSYIGERGPEAIVPFTDNAQMELLGSSIGKHIKINATIINEIEGRVFGKVMKEINNENQFARNGG